MGANIDLSLRDNLCVDTTGYQMNLSFQGVLLRQIK